MGVRGLCVCGGGGGDSPGTRDVLLRGAHRAVFQDRLNKSGSLELNGRELCNGLAIFAIAQISSIEFQRAGFVQSVLENRAVCAARR